MPSKLNFTVVNNEGPYAIHYKNEVGFPNNGPFSNVKDWDFAKEIVAFNFKRLREIKNSEEYRGLLCCSINDDVVPIEQMIVVALKAKSEYMSFFNGINSIINHFLYSPLTEKKEEILKDFQNYCVDHVDADTDRVKLVSDWHKAYLNSHPNVNPFDILRQHRRTGFLSIFNPEKTDSIKLFDTYLQGLELPEDLKTLINGTEPTQSVLVKL